MEHPRRLNVPGEELPKVQHLFVEPYAYVRKDALVVGGGNSAAEAALFLSEEGARTTMAIWREDWDVGVNCVGEPPAVPILGAVGTAVANAVGVQITSMPLTPDKILAALAGKEHAT